MTDEVVVSVVAVALKKLVSVDPLLFPHPTASVSTAAPPTIVILVLDAVLDPDGMRTLTLNSATLRFTRNPPGETAAVSGVTPLLPGFERLPDRAPALPTPESLQAGQNTTAPTRGREVRSSAHIRFAGKDLTPFPIVLSPRRVVNYRHTVRFAWVLVAVTASLAACSTAPPPVRAEHVRRESFGGAWPFTPAAGTLTCHLSKGGSITFTPDGSRTAYAVDETADEWSDKEGWHPMSEIALDDPGLPGLKVSERDAVREGRKICEAAG